MACVAEFHWWIEKTLLVQASILQIRLLTNQILTIRIEIYLTRMSRVFSSDGARLVDVVVGTDSLSPTNNLCEK